MCNTAVNVQNCSQSEYQKRLRVRPLTSVNWRHRVLAVQRCGPGFWSRVCRRACTTIVPRWISEEITDSRKRRSSRSPVFERTCLPGRDERSRRRREDSPCSGPVEWARLSEQTAISTTDQIRLSSPRSTATGVCLCRCRLRWDRDEHRPCTPPDWWRRAASKAIPFDQRWHLAFAERSPRFSRSDSRTSCELQTDRVEWPPHWVADHVDQEFWGQRQQRKTKKIDNDISSATRNKKKFHVRKKTSRHGLSSSSLQR